MSNRRKSTASEGRLTRARLAEFDITVDQFVVLTLLVLLEKRGLIRREPCTRDARARLVFLTSKGRRLQKKLLIAGPKQVPSYLDGVLSDDELRTLLRCLDKIAAAAASAERSPDRKERSREFAQAEPFTKVVLQETTKIEG